MNSIVLSTVGFSKTVSKTENLKYHASSKQICRNKCASNLGDLLSGGG